MTVNSPAPLILGTSVGVTPKEGPKCVPVVAQLAANSSVILDLTNLQQQGKISCIQGVFVDNSQNNNSVTIAVGTTGQNIVVPALSQATLPVLVAMIPIFTVSSAGGVNVPLFFTNVALYAEVWNTTAFTFTSGKLVVSDPALEALISSNALNVNVVSGPPAAKRILFAPATITAQLSAAAGAGKYWHITDIVITVTSNISMAAISTINIQTSFTNGADVVHTFYYFVPSGASGTSQFNSFNINFSNAIQSSQTNDTIQIQMGGTTNNFASGSINYNVYGYAS